MFNRDPERFPVKKEFAYLANCGIAAQYAPAVEAARAFMDLHSRRGMAVFMEYGNPLDGVLAAAAELLGTADTNLAFVKNTSEAINMIANGYPFEPGDRVISYVHEYPANHYPWVLQKQRGVDLVLLGDHPGDLKSESAGAREYGPAPTGPTGWSFAELEELATDKTRMIAISHVQFTSGFAADLPRLGAFCEERGIDLVLDAAQSLGGLPVLPEEWNIAAVAASGWKWLLGPIGTGLFYTRPDFRAKLAHTMVGAELMTQGFDYLDHRWQPVEDARRFHYSTAPHELGVALEATLRDNFLTNSPADIRAENFRLQQVFLDALDTERYRPLLWNEKHRSGILSLRAPGDPVALSKALFDRGIFAGERSGYLRIAPHFYNDDDEMRRAAAALNEL